VREYFAGPRGRAAMRGDADTLETA
jgi:hypothetical protein